MEGSFCARTPFIWEARTRRTDTALRPSSEGMFLGFMLK
jgi:hypothetical protein